MARQGEQRLLMMVPTDGGPDALGTLGTNPRRALLCDFAACLLLMFHIVLNVSGMERGCRCAFVFILRVPSSRAVALKFRICRSSIAACSVEAAIVSSNTGSPPL